MRAHGHIDMKKREPYRQTEEVQKVIRASLALRYELIHYSYTLFHQASTKGLPIIRPMWMEFKELDIEALD